MLQHPDTAFPDQELQRGSVQTTNMGLPFALSGGFALTYTISTASKKYAVRCFHREVPKIQEKYAAISQCLRSLNSQYFVEFTFLDKGIRVNGSAYPIVRMDWVEGDTLGVYLDKNAKKQSLISDLRLKFHTLSKYLEDHGIAHGDIQNGNVMVVGNELRLIDYDGMFVPGMALGGGTEVGHKHFQHPGRAKAHFGPNMDRFSFIVMDVSLQALIEDGALYYKFSEGSETIIFTANDFADPATSERFQYLFQRSALKLAAERLACVCSGEIGEVPTLDDFLAGQNIPRAKVPPLRIVPPEKLKPPPRVVEYIPAFDVVDATNYAAASQQVGNKVELIGQIVEVKESFARRGKGRGRPYVFINFGPWRGNIVKVTVWSEGLIKLSEKPNSSWVGRWISVTGLMDPPYHSKRHRYSHLSVTVTENGQIQHISEQEAQYRLGAKQKQTASSNQDVMKRIVRGSPISRPTARRRRQQAVGTSVSPSPGMTNKQILETIKQGSAAPETQPRPTAQYHQQRPQPQKSRSSFRGWLWFGVILIVLYFLLQS